MQVQPKPLILHGLSWDQPSDAFVKLEREPGRTISAFQSLNSNVMMDAVTSS